MGAQGDPLAYRQDGEGLFLSKPFLTLLVNHSLVYGIWSGFCLLLDESLSFIYNQPRYLTEYETNCIFTLPVIVCATHPPTNHLFIYFTVQMEPTGPTQQPTARTPSWTPWWKVLTTTLTLCPTWATTLIHCQTLVTPRTWWTATSWPGLTPTCRIGKEGNPLRWCVENICVLIAAHWWWMLSCALSAAVFWENLHSDWPVLSESALWLACRVVEGKEGNKGSWKVPDTRKQRRWLPRECLSKLKWGSGSGG